MRYLVMFILLAVISGCAAGLDPRPNLPSTESDTCQARDYQAYLNQSVTALETVLILKPVRIIRPGTAITKDFRQNRINFHLNGDDIIQSISCG